MTDHPESESLKATEERGAKGATGARITPEMLLHRLLEHDDIEGLVVVVYAKDGTMDVCTTQIRLDTLAYAKVHLDKYILDILSGELPERTVTSPQ